MKNKNPVGQKLESIAPTPKAITQEAMLLLFLHLKLHFLKIKITSAFIYMICEDDFFVNIYFITITSAQPALTFTDALSSITSLLIPESNSPVVKVSAFIGYFKPSYVTVQLEKWLL